MAASNPTLDFIRASFAGMTPDELFAYADAHPEIQAAQAAADYQGRGSSASPQAIANLNRYIASTYGDGTPPRAIRELQEIVNGERRGSANDYSIASAIYGDANSRTPLRIGPTPFLDVLGTGNQPHIDDVLSPYLQSELTRPGREINALSWEEGGRRIDGAGLGIFGPIASIAGAAFGMPALTALSFAASNPDSPLSIAGPALAGYQAGNFAPTSGGGFTNPAGLDFAGTGTGANALGLPTTLGGPMSEAWSGATGALGGFVNPSAIATPSAINEAINYTPVSLGGTIPSSRANDALRAGLRVGQGLLSLADEPQPQGATGGLLGRAQSAARAGYQPLAVPPPPSFQPYFDWMPRAR